MKYERMELGFFLLAVFSGSFSIAISQIALGLSLLIAVVRWLTKRTGLVVTGTEKTMLLLIIWAVALVPFSVDPPQSLVFLRRFYLFAGLPLAASLATTEQRRRLIFVAIIGGSAAVSLFSIIQAERHFGGLFVARMAQISNSMTSGGVLLLTALLALGVLLHRQTSRRARGLVAASLLPILVALLMTMTRSALVGLTAGGLVVLFGARRRWFVVAVALSVVLVAGGARWGEQLLPAALWARVCPENVLRGENTRGRLAMWQVGWQIFREHPLTGVGDVDLVGVAPATYGEGWPFTIGHLHNNLVQIAVIWGLPGLILALFFWGQQWRLLWRRWQAAPAPWQGGWLVGAMGMWAGFFVAGLTEWYFGDAEPMLLYMAILGVALGAAPVLSDTDLKPGV